MIWTIDPESLRRPLYAFVGLVLLLALFFGWGYWTATSRAAAQLKGAVEQEHHLAAEKAGAAGEALEVKVEAQDKKTQSAAKRRAVAEAKVASFHLPETLPNIPASQPIIAFREEVAAYKAENDELRTENLLLKQEAAQYKDAWKQEALHSLALQGQLVAQQADERKHIYKAGTKGFTIGVGVGVLGAFVLNKK